MKIALVFTIVFSVMFAIMGSIDVVQRGGGVSLPIFGSMYFLSIAIGSYVLWKKNKYFILLLSIFIVVLMDVVSTTVSLALLYDESGLTALENNNVLLAPVYLLVLLGHVAVLFFVFKCHWKNVK